MHVKVRRFHNSSMRFQISGKIGIITINRSESRNSLSREMWDTLSLWCSELPSRTQLLVIRGSGTDFTAGSDLKEFINLSIIEANESFEKMEQTIQTLENLLIPTIASINGPAFGAGFMLALGCDVRIGSPLARFGMPVGRLGITLQPPFIDRMIKHLGIDRCKELIFTARSIDAEEGLTLGLLSQIVPSKNLDEKTFELAEIILQQSAASLSAVKTSISAVINKKELTTRKWVDDTDFVEGVRAFQEKRKANFNTVRK
ncbi:MAG: enoyl-CoA hydratase-related protein [Acidibacillus sp.]|nr:enoyl-CoA hydratase-related protein [Acidibacillus sp.]